MRGWAYLATVIDGYSRKVVGWSIDRHMRESLVCDALTMAIHNRRPAVGEVAFHSDRGSQYTGTIFRDLCLGNGIIPSVEHTGICFDNAAAESFNATLKKELINHQPASVERHRHSQVRGLRIHRNLLQPPAESKELRLSHAGLVRGRN
jgi:putative transposase